MRQVRLILIEDVPNLGSAGDLVSVKPGYARNFLLRRGAASLATDAKVAQLEHQKRVIEERLAKQLKSFQSVKSRIEAKPVEVAAQAGEEGKLFGSVTSAQLVELLAERGLEIDRRKIDLPDPIKSIGEHVVPIKLHRELVAELVVVVSAAD